MSGSYPFSANILKHIFSPKLVTNVSGGYDVKVDLVNIDNVTATGAISGSSNSKITAPNGSETAPSITFASDTTTGLYLAETGRINASIGGIQRASLNSGALVLRGELGVVGKITTQANITVNPTGASVDSVNISNDGITTTGNISTTGDGNVTGGVNAVYLGLTDYSSIAPNPGPPVTNYLYSNNGQPIWENSTQSVNLLGWVSKLAQNTDVSILPDASGGTQLNDVIHAYNNLVNLFYQQGLIYTAPRPTLSIPTTFDVKAASTYTPYTGSYIRNQQLQVMNMNHTVWPSNLTLITQIQSVVINVYSGINKGTNYISDARVILTSTESTPVVFYAYGRRITPQSGDDFAVGTTATFTDRNVLQQMFSTIGSPSDTIDTARDINAYWYCGYAGNQIKNCQILSFVINYSHL
jgi:hypothetical protein